MPELSGDNNNVVLLQIMAHDLLAPLTAIKWQLELLEKGYKDKEKRERYLQSLASSTELGIALTKHAHVAGSVLAHTYEGVSEKAKLSEVVKRAVVDLVLQYERHALTLDVGSFAETREQDVDASLVQLYVWSVAKFFLACSSPYTKVSMNGALDSDTFTYIFTASTSNLIDTEKCMHVLTTQESAKSLDQMSMFSTLIRESATHLHISFDVKETSGFFTLTTSFPL